LSVCCPGADRGAGPCCTTSPPGQSRERPLRRNRLAAHPAGWSVLFPNSVVSHTRITHLRAIRRPHGLLISREVSGNLHNTVFTSLVVDCVSRVVRDSSFASLATHDLPSATRTNGSTRRDVACCRSRTLTDHNFSRAHSGRRVARRRIGPGSSITHRSCGRGRVTSQACLRGDASGGPIGVVKFLRARGGCLGVISIRAWKAAISPGELPNERRSRNARGTQGTETSQYLEERKSTETP
jgi:hypothetical protein